MTALTVGPVRLSVLHGNCKHKAEPKYIVTFSLRYSVTADSRRCFLFYRALILQITYTPCLKKVAHYI